MLVCALADLHLQEKVNDFQQTLPEQLAGLHWAADDAERAGVDLVVIAGDIFEGRSTALERNAAIEITDHLASIAPVVIVQGNHEEPHGLDFLGKLDTRRGVYVADGYLHIEGGLCGADIHCIAWPNRGWLAASGSDPGQQMRNLLMGITPDVDWPKIIIGHLEVGAAVSDGGQPSSGRCFIELSEQDLVYTGAEACLLGHIHKPQTIGEHIRYAGCPIARKFDDTGSRGYTLAHVEKGLVPVFEHREVPGRKMITIAGNVIGGELLWDDQGEYGGSSVRLKYDVPEAHRQNAHLEAQRKRQELLDAGCHAVKLDGRTIAEERTRSEEIKTARTNADRLEALWVSTGERPEGADRMLGKLAEVAE